MKAMTSLLAILFISTGLLAVTVEDEYKEAFPLKPGGELAVKNVNGSITVESWDKSEVEIVANIKVKAGSRRTAEQFLEKVEIIVKGNEDGLEIEVDHPRLKGSDGFLDFLFGGDKPNVTVQFHLMVPRECDLSSSSVNGRISVKDVHGLIDLHTVNGRIEATNLSGAVDASTTNGSMEIEIVETRPREEMRFKTVNGSVKVYLPKDVAADLSVSTVNGSIRCDFPLEIKGKWGPKKAQGEINGGGPDVHISTVNGSVTLASR